MIMGALLLHWEKNVWLCNPQNKSLTVCVYNVDCEGKIVEKRGTVPIRGKFMKRWDFKRS